LSAFVDIVWSEKSFEVTEGLSKCAFVNHAHDLEVMRSNDTYSF